MLSQTALFINLLACMWKFGHSKGIGAAGSKILVLGPAITLKLGTYDEVADQLPIGLSRAGSISVDGPT
jgi:hypothetical protein